MFPVKIIGDPVATDRDIAIAGPGGAAGGWCVPEETPVAFVYNRRNYAVMLATPQDMVDYAVGFSLTERVVDAVDQIVDLDILHSDRGIDLRLRIDDALLARFDMRQRRRNLPGNAGCGVCGLENADEFFAVLPTVAEPKVSIEPGAIARAFEALGAAQPLNQRTRSVHAAAWVNFAGAIEQVREDVGRHNALDKLLGALMREGVDIKAGFVVMSSRCSYELVEKAARCGVTALATISGPTNFALKKAKEANMALYARADAGIVEILD